MIEDEEELFESAEMICSNASRDSGGAELVDARQGSVEEIELADPELIGATGSKEFVDPERIGATEDEQLVDPEETAVEREDLVDPEEEVVK